MSKYIKPDTFTSATKTIKFSKEDGHVLRETLREIARSTTDQATNREGFKKWLKKTIGIQSTGRGF